MEDAGSKYIIFAIPAFFLLIGVELLASRALGRRVYRLNDSINNLACGILQQLVGVFTKGLTVAAYIALYNVTGFVELSLSSVGTWVGAFLAVDFCYYWFHRVSHRCNLVWATHIVHHQSEEYNLSVALRQGSLQQLTSWPFYLPLAIIGVPPVMYLTASAFDTLYQFWIHTRLINRMGPLEWVLNTPSHHRVHHGKDPKYIDKNYAGILIIWDRLFGTFEPEEQAPTYGVTEQLASWNPVWANAQYFRHIAQHAAPLSRKERLKAWFMPPEWLFGAKPEGTPQGLFDGAPDKYDAGAPAGLNRYIFAQFVLVVGMALFVLAEQGRANFAESLLGAGMVAWSLVNLGGLFEQRSWAPTAEWLRMPVLFVFGVWSVGQLISLPAGVLVGSAVSALSAYGLWRQIGLPLPASRAT